MFKGTYKKKLNDGTSNFYGPLDTVLFHGKIYQAKISTCFSPVEKPTAWEFRGVSEVYASDNPPLDPKIGQIWTTNGRFYSYYYDGNNYSWVEI